MPPPDPANRPAPATIATANATFCATLVEELVRLGAVHAVLCPGSRSTPLALALAAAEPGLRLHVHHDERSGGFLAVGLALASGRPTIVVTTSGTAAVELHPAVVEAHHAGVALVVLTADRPPELQDVGAPQTIDQTHLYGRSVRWFAAPGPPDGGDPSSWRGLAARAYAEAQGSLGTGPPGARPGPVHLNLAFREPLAGTPGPLPPRRNAGDQAWRRRLASGAAAAPDHTTVQALATAFAAKQGIIVAGGGIDAPDGVHALAGALGWPVLADARSGCRTVTPHTIAHFDGILRHEPFAETTRPQVVLRLGALPASKVLGRWLAGLDGWQVAAERSGATHDPDHVLAAIVAAEPGGLCQAVLDAIAGPDGGVGGNSGFGSSVSAATAWLTRWVRADANAAEAIASVLSRHEEPTEPQIARHVLAAVPDGGHLVVSSSMPVRDLEWFAAPRDHVTVYANRGANGIDGVVSTALGVALASARPTVLLIGDVAFLHDSNGLLGAGHRAGADLTVVVVDNDGGGIFEFLPQAGHVERSRFERLFGTPHGVDIPALATVHGATVLRPPTAADVGPAVRAATATGGLHVVHVRTDRTANVTLHNDLDLAIAQALFRS